MADATSKPRIRKDDREASAAGHVVPLLQRLKEPVVLLASDQETIRQRLGLRISLKIRRPVLQDPIENVVNGCLCVSMLR